MIRRVAHAALVVLAMVTAGCGIPSQSSARKIDDANVPFGLLDPPTNGSKPSPTSTIATAETRVVFMVRDDRLVAVARPVGATDSASQLRLLLDGPTAEEADRGIRTALVSPDAVLSVTPQGDIATVDLDAAFADAPPAEQRLALAQLTFTLTELPAITQVAFTLGGKPTSVPRADGTTTDGPVNRADYRALGP